MVIWRERGRFKQNDCMSLNGMSGFNTRGNFITEEPIRRRDPGPMHRVTEHRARDAARSRK